MNKNVVGACILTVVLIVVSLASLAYSRYKRSRMKMSEYTLVLKETPSITSKI